MSAASEARLSALDGVLDTQQPSTALADELFDVVDTLTAQPGLRRTLTDPSLPEAARGQLVSTLFSERISVSAVTVLAEAAQLRWTSSSALPAAIERQAVRTLLRVAQQAGNLGEVEDQLFKVERLVSGDRGLQAAVNDRQSSVEARRSLLGGLVAHRVLPITQALARHAVTDRTENFEDNVESYLKAAAQLRERAIATVEVARPLSDEQFNRLRAALSRQVGRDVNLRVVIDPYVVGGARVTLGDEVIEGTVAGRLTDAQRKLA